VDLSTGFKNFLKTLYVEGGSDGMLLSSAQKPRTLYSLRHFYAISRLRQGVDVFRLAENMGTGVTQIRNHYGRHISGDAYVKELTKYESKSVSKVKNEALAKLVDMVQTGIIDEENGSRSVQKCGCRQIWTDCTVKTCSGNRWSKDGAVEHRFSQEVRLRAGGLGGDFFSTKFSAQIFLADLLSIKTVSGAKVGWCRWCGCIFYVADSALTN
jgi:hypothetical protein